MYLTETRKICQHEEVELLLEGYKLDLEEIQVSIRTMLAQVMKDRDPLRSIIFYFDLFFKANKE